MTKGVPAPTRKEHQAFYEGAQARLDAALGKLAVRAAYVRGDFFGDRTEEMYAYGGRFKGHPKLMASAIRAVQAHVRSSPGWSVILPLGNGRDRALMIHPRKLTFGDRRLNERWLQELCRRYVAYCLRHERRKRARMVARLDAIAPYLQAALRRARARRFPVFVADVRGPDGPGVWAVHPEARYTTLQSRHKIQPECYTSEIHELDDAGRFIPDESARKRPARSHYLVLWTPQQPAARVLRIARADRSITWTLAALKGDRRSRKEQERGHLGIH